MSISYYYHQLRRDLTNFSFLRHARFEGYIITMPQSGTHWLKHMLAEAIAREFHLPPPRYNHASDIIGGPKDPKVYPDIFSLAHSHTIPGPLIRSNILRSILKLPRYVVLVRDIRASLASNYEKRKDSYDCCFSEYLRGDVAGKKYSNDIWSCIRFINSWGRTLEKYPDQVLLVKYEAILADTLKQLVIINDFLNLGLSKKSLVYGIEESSKEKLKSKEDPSPLRSKGSIRLNKVTYIDMISEEDNKFFIKTCNDYLNYDFGYDYS